MTRGNAGVPCSYDQMVYRECGPDSKQDLTPFAALLVAPDKNVSTFPLFINSGLVYLGVVYGKFSDRLRRVQRVEQLFEPSIGVQRYELALEWTI